MTEPTRRRPGKVSDEELLTAAAVAKNMLNLLTLLGIAPYGGNYESTRRRLAGLGTLEERFVSRRPSTAAHLHAYSDDELRETVTKASTKADILRGLRLPVEPVHYLELNRRISAAGLDTSHLRARAWNRGRRDLPKLSPDPPMILAAALRLKTRTGRWLWA
jgi:hypothetical protein